jgi:hypothetical protein
MTDTALDAALDEPTPPVVGKGAKGRAARTGNKPQRVSRTEARTGAAVVALRLAGAGFDEIADALSLPSAQVARTQMEAALAKRAWEDNVGRDRLRAEASARLETLLQVTWVKATSPTHVEQLTAAKVALAIVDRLIRLHGLDAPQEVVLYNPTGSELESWVTSILSNGSRAFAALEANVIDADGAVHWDNPDD